MKVGSRRDEGRERLGRSREQSGRGVCAVGAKVGSVRGEGREQLMRGEGVVGARVGSGRGEGREQLRRR